jgi:CheY-like chemotaxis protein
MTRAAEFLLVEDDEADVELTLHALKQNKIINRVHVARDGEEALDFLFHRGKFAGRGPNDVPRVVLLDLKLPRVDGLEVLRQAKRDARTKCIPVVILTSSREERDVVQGYELGVNSYITKPVNFDQFCEVVRQLGMYWAVVNEAPPTPWIAA